MKRNIIKIVCNPFLNKISYFYKNEIGEWLLLSGSSPLSRQSCTKTNIKDSCISIVEKLNEVYNRKNKGLDILFEGTSDDYEFLSNAVNTCFGNRNIKCRMNPTRIAIVGKRGVGKTALIEGIAKAHGYKLIKTDNTHYVKYEDKHNHIEWLEVKGIDIGSENVEEAYNVLADLVNDGLSKVIYCVLGSTGKMEEIEKRLIIELKESFPSIDIITAITMCYKDNIQAAIDEIKKYVGNDNIFPVLAKEYRSSIKNRGMETSFVVEPFGLDELTTFVFEGKRLFYKLPKKKTDEKTPVYDKKKNASIESEYLSKMQMIAVAGKKAVGTVIDLSSDRE